MAKTCSVMKAANGMWITKCSKCPYKSSHAQWHKAASAGWMHTCPPKN